MPSRYAHFCPLVALAVVLAAPLAAPAEELKMPGDPLAGTVLEHQASPTTSGATTSGNYVPMGVDPGVIDAGPMSAQYAGTYYNPTLGSHIRARYNTQSYGQQEGTFDLGTMKLFDVDGGKLFVDGQVTMNDESHVGYNLGVGYRWLTLPLLPYSPDDAKIMGVSLWSDGTTVGGENFFPQIGASLEFLGDHLDFRANGYAPLGEQDRTRDFVDTGGLTYSGNNLAQLLQGIQDTALTVGEAELAGRIADLDAWVFGGVYGVNGGPVDAVGGKIGLRGYLTPDLFLSIAVSDDEEFDTLALFNITWFIGRTRAENCPTGALTDRFRQPVLRNNYVATRQSVAFGTGDAIVDTDGDAIRIVHVDSSAAAGGDGSFENPLNSLDDVQANSQTDDIILAHANSTFDGQGAVLRDRQVFVGEGGNNVFSVDTLAFGTVDLPETAAGAQSGAVPIIANAPAAGVTLADNNTVRNLSFDGGVNAIVNSAAGSHNATLQELSIANTTGDGISLTAVVAADADDIDGDDNLTETVNKLGAIVIDEVTFDSIGGNDIDIDGLGATAEGADLFIAETVAISNVTSTGGSATDQSIAIRNTTTGGTATLDTYTYDGGTTGAGGVLIEENFGSVAISNADFTGGAGIAIEATSPNAATNGDTTGAITINNATYDGGTTAMGGLRLNQTTGTVNVTNTDFSNGIGPAIEAQATEGVVSVGASSTITDIAGDAVVVNGNTATVTIDADIDTATTVDGGTVRVTSNEALVDLGGNLTANNANSVVITGARGDVNIGGVNGDITNTGTQDAIVISNGDATEQIAVTINGAVTNDEGLSLSVDNIDDTVQFVDDITDNGSGIVIMNLADTAEVLFGPQVTLNTGTDATVAVNLDNNHEDSVVDFVELDITMGTGTGLVSTGGQVNVTGTNSTISTTSGRAIVVDSSHSQSSGNIAFSRITATDTSGTAPISFNDYDGTVSLGSTGNANDSTVSSTGTGIFLADVTNATVTNLTVTGATGTGVDIQENDNDADSSVTLADVDLVAGLDRGVRAVEAAIDANSGEISVAISDSTMDDTTVTGLDFQNVDGTVSVTNTTLENGAGRGVHIQNGDGTFTFSDSVAISGKDNNAFEVDGGTGSVTYNGSIESTVARSVAVQNKTGGGVTFGATSTVTDSGEGVLVNANMGGTYNFLGEMDLDTTTNDAVTVTGNTGASVSFAELDIATTTGTAFTATGGGTIGVTGSSNVITTTDGDGVIIDGMTISTVAFDSVDVGTVGAATTAVSLTNNTGGVVTIGDALSSTDGDGGTFNTSGTAVVVSNSGGLVMRNVDITATGSPSIDIDSTNGTDMTVTLSNVDTVDDVSVNHTAASDVVFTYNDSTVNGSIDIDHSGSGTFDFNSDNLVVNGFVDVDATGSGALDFFSEDLQIDTGGAVDDGLNIALGSTLTQVDISITGANTSIATGSGAALAIASSGSAKQIRFELSSAVLSNDSTTSNTFAMSVAGGSTANTTINSNMFTNADTGGDFLYTNGASSTTRMAISGNDASAAGGLVLTNNNAASRFSILGANDGAVNSDNNGDVTFTGGAGNFTFDGSLNVTLPSN